MSVLIAGLADLASQSGKSTCAQRTYMQVAHLAPDAQRVHWVLRATIGHAARLTVKDNCRGTPTFLQYEPWPQGSSIG